MSPYQNQIVDYLKEVIHPNSIKAVVAQEAIDCPNEDVPTFLNDVLEYGCRSGVVNCMIYYHDIHRFFDEHYIEIENMRCDLEESLGHPLEIKGELKTFFARLAFE